MSILIMVNLNTKVFDLLYQLDILGTNLKVRFDGINRVDFSPLSIASYDHSISLIYVQRQLGFFIQYIKFYKNEVPTTILTTTGLHNKDDDPGKQERMTIPKGHYMKH